MLREIKRDESLPVGTLVRIKESYSEEWPINDCYGVVVEHNIDRFDKLSGVVTDSRYKVFISDHIFSFYWYELEVETCAISNQVT